jgi:flagellar motor component MotA
MAEEQKPQRWWQTVPGILTATAGIITAVTGLIVALH